jgi:transcriptional regulator with XRE-family HTH domain
MTPGLRREELAALAGVGLTWYTWLEQGRDIVVSSETLERVARALGLTPSDEAYLFTLAGVTPARVRETASAVTPALRLALDGFRAGPAIVFAPNFDVLAHNDLAEVVYAFSAVSGRFARNHLWRLFLDPARRRLYARDLELGERNLVGILRARYAEHLGEPEFEELLEELLGKSPEFERIWNDRETKPLGAPPLIPISHPHLGALCFHSVRLTPADAPASALYLLTPADSATSLAMSQAQPSLEPPPST